MDFSWSAEQLSLKNAAARFAQDELNDGLDEREARGELNRAGWCKCAEFGVLGLPLPPPYGSGRDMLTIVAALEGLGYGCRDNGLLFALGAQLWSVQMPILSFGSPAQHDRYLGRLANGEIVGAHSVSEPGNGSDVFGMRTVARRDGDDYVLNGAKTYVSSAPVADLFLVLATVDRAKGAGGITAFLVERGTPGLSVPRHLEKMGLRTSPMGEVVFDQCRVPADQLLGQEGAGMNVFNTAMDWERAFLLTPYLGSMQRQLEWCVQRARVRDSRGKVVEKDEAVATTVVEMYLRLEAARLLTYRAAWLRTVGRRFTREPSEVKLLVSDAFVHNSDDALQIHGDAGYLEAAAIERDWRDARASKIYSGTTEIQKMIIGRWLGV
jgi:alkylation response protein AidB-like acyl-CoA dehydrogenase